MTDTFQSHGASPGSPTEPQFPANPGDTTDTSFAVPPGEIPQGRTLQAPRGPATATTTVAIVAWS